MRTWPQASLHLHSLEKENYRQAQDVGAQLGVRVFDLPEPTHEIKDGEMIFVGDTIQLRAIHTPGHAPGHVAFVDERATSDSNGSVIFGGDLLFRGSVGRTDFPNSSLDDLYASVRRLTDMFVDDSIVLSGHTTPTKIGIEKEYNPFLYTALKRPKEWYDEAKARHEWFS